MSHSILLDTIRGKEHQRPPVWFMRQAGRTLPYYQKLRKQYSFREIMNNPELAASVTLEPVSELGVDGAIIFTDILIIAEALGMKTNFGSNGPTLDFSLQEASDPRKLLSHQPEKLKTVSDTIDLVRKNKPENIPTIGFCGAPFTVLNYMLKGKGPKNDHTNLARYVYQKPLAFERLMETITDITTTYAILQMDAGVDIFQIFDTHAGALPYHVYEKYCLPYVRKIIQTVRNRNIPVIYFPKGIGLGYAEMNHTITDYLSVDWQTSITELRKVIDTNLGLQGNIDPRLLLADQKHIEEKFQEYIPFAQKDKRWIFNLGHGILPNTPLENIKFLVNRVKSSDWKRS